MENVNNTGTKKDSIMK